MTAEDMIQLDLPASYKYLSVLSAALAEMLQKVTHLVDCEQTTYNIQLAAHEVCTNIINHAYADVEEGRIRVSIELGESPPRIVIGVADQGKSFDFDAVPEPDFETLQEHGFGLFIVHQLMDKVHYERQGNRNLWELVKYF